MKTVFRDPEHEAEFRKKGFLVLPYGDAIWAHDIKDHLLSLRPNDAYEGNQPTLIGQQSFHITFFDANAQYKQQVFAYAQMLLKDFTRLTFNGYVCAQANAFIKPSGKGFVHPHQNLTIVDEEKYTSVSVWIPLQDTNLKNGTLCVVPGSQNGFEIWRNTHVYWPYIDFFRNGEGRSYFEAINVKAGEVLILDDRIVHYTPENKSSEDRWVFHSLWKPEEAEVLFTDPGEEDVKIYKVNTDFWQQSMPGERPPDTAPVITLPRTDRKMNESELLNFLEQLRAAQRP
jgi:hypothetical protein